MHRIGCKRWIAACLIALCSALPGCASVQDFAGISRAGYQPDGSYIVSSDEEKLACRQIGERLEMLSRQMQTLPQQAALEKQTAPMTVGSAFGRVFGGPDGGLKATTDFQRAKAESDALKSLAAKKQCA